MSHSRSTRATSSAGLLCALAGASLLGSASSTQQAAVASVSGVVFEWCRPNPVPGVRVTLSDDAVRRWVFTDVEGRFSFGETPVGTYVLTSEIDGFLTVTHTVAVSARTPEIQIDMELGPLWGSHSMVIARPGDVYRGADALVRLVIQRTGEQFTGAGAPLMVLDATVLDVFKAPAPGGVPPGRTDPPPPVGTVAAGRSIQMLQPWARGPSSSQNWLAWAYATGDERVALLRWAAWCRREEGWVLESSYPVRGGLVSVRSYGESDPWRALDGLAPVAFAGALARLAREP